MKKLATCVVTVAALTGTSVFAADMAVKAPPTSPPEPVFNWTGFYVGGNLGASFGRAKTDFNAAPVLVTGIGNGPFAVPGVSDSDTVYPSGFMGGGQIGYNWQFSPIWVVGFEADFQGAVEKESATLTNPFNFLFVVGTVPNLRPPPSSLTLTTTVTGSTVLDYATKIDWFGTVRGRIGYVWGNGAVMSYVTGGLAYGEVKLDGTNAVSGSVSILPFSITQAFSHSNVNTGWTVGFGTEGRLLIPGWTYKIDALYIDLGTLDATGVTSGASAPVGLGVTGGQVSTHTHFTDSILRVGLNYLFH